MDNGRQGPRCWRSRWGQRLRACFAVCVWHIEVRGLEKEDVDVLHKAWEFRFGSIFCHLKNISSACQSIVDIDDNAGNLSLFHYKTLFDDCCLLKFLKRSVALHRMRCVA